MRFAVISLSRLQACATREAWARLGAGGDATGGIRTSKWKRPENMAPSMESGTEVRVAMEVVYLHPPTSSFTFDLWNLITCAVRRRECAALHSEPSRGAGGMGADDGDGTFPGGVQPQPWRAGLRRAGAALSSTLETPLVPRATLAHRSPTLEGGEDAVCALRRVWVLGDKAPTSQAAFRPQGWCPTHRRSEGTQAKLPVDGSVCPT